MLFRKWRSDQNQRSNGGTDLSGAKERARDKTTNPPTRGGQRRTGLCWCLHSKARQSDRFEAASAHS